MKVVLSLFALLPCLSLALPLPDSPPSYSAPAPAQYTYSYAVQDDYSKVNFGAEESREGYATSGSYYVALPDGRLQKVSYSVDGEGGYVADVSYEGEAQYPEVKPYSPPAAPAYKPSA